MYSLSHPLYISKLFIWCRSCQICGDDVGLTVDGELFVACNECAFPICRTCYEYERQEGSQVCPQCKTRFKRLKGCARVEGDEEEDGIDDVENEFNFEGRVGGGAKLASHHNARSEDAMLYGGRNMIYRRSFESDLPPLVLHNTFPQVPLLTNGYMVRVSTVLTNAPYLLNLDCDHYINNCKALREAMCFMMDPLLGKRVCYVQFPQGFDGIDKNDRYANRNTVFFDINMKGLDGIQGPIYAGTGCVFRRQALYGYDAPKIKKPPTRTCNCLPKW